jgi:hypothetical protein
MVPDLTVLIRRPYLHIFRRWRQRVTPKRRYHLIDESCQTHGQGQSAVSVLQEEKLDARSIAGWIPLKQQRVCVFQTAVYGFVFTHLEWPLFRICDSVTVLAVQYSSWQSSNKEVEGHSSHLCVFIFSKCINSLVMVVLAHMIKNWCVLSG